MSLLKNIRAFLLGPARGGAHTTEIPLEAEEKLIGYLVSLINRQDLIAEELEGHERVKNIQDASEQKLAYAKLYFQLEDFLVTNKPLVTKKEFTDAQAVRDDVVAHKLVDALSPPTRLIFSLQNEQAADLFNIALPASVNYIRNNLGEAELASTLRSATEGTILEGVEVEGDSLGILNARRKIGMASFAEVTFAFKKVHKVLLEKLTLVFGDKTAAAVAKKMYDSIAGNFDQGIVSLFLDVLPEGFLEAQKLLVLSREELEKRVLEATQALRREKEGVEQKVIERTQELKQKVVELKTANDRLTELDKIKTEFISVAAHQLRTPLSAVKWTLSLLVDEDSENLSSKQRSLLLKGYESNERMIRLIDEMLVVTRIESGKMQFNFSFIHIEDLIDNVLLDFAGQVHVRKMHLAFERPGTPLPHVNADPEKIRAVIQNLIENALNYTKDGGAIILSARLENNFIRVQVKDNGIGIPLGQKSGIFNKFFRAENASKAKTDGSGLGLFVAKSIVDKHGGQIGFESAEGMGSTFYFTIPCADAHA